MVFNITKLGLKPSKIHIQLIYMSHDIYAYGAR
jgi:hypothetical protein